MDDNLRRLLRQKLADGIAMPLLLSLDMQPPDLCPAGSRVRWQPAIEWLLEPQA